MSLVGKLTSEILIAAPAHEFHGVWGGRPHHFSNVSPEKIQKVHLHDGDWGTVGSIIQWHYVLDGKEQVVKHLVEDIDEENKIVIFNIIDGDLLKEYKSFKAIVQSIPKGEATWVCWTFEYEKLNKDITHPTKILEFLIHLSEELNDHLIET